MKYSQQTPSHGNVKIDQLDRKILHELAQNSRNSYTRIAKAAGTSRDTAAYRITNLTRAGVIQGYRTVIDVGTLGYFSAHIFLQLNQPTPSAEEQLIKTFKKYPFVRAIIKFHGKYDFELAVIARSLQEFDSILTTVVNDCAGHLQNYEILFITKGLIGRTFPQNFIREETTRTNPKSLETPDVDKTDLKLMATIADHADLPLFKIAEELQLSPDAVKYRLKALTRSGVIKGFIPVINYDALNYHVYAILLNITNLTDKRESTLKEFILTNPDILWAVKTIGRYNVLLYVCTQNPNDLVKTTSALRSNFPDNIKDFETLINYEEYAYTYFCENLGRQTE